MAEEKKELFAKINADLQKAMKEKKELLLSTLRMVKSKILYVNARGDLADNEILKIIKKYGKELKESIEEFKKVGRNDDAGRVEKELEIVATYLPKEMAADEVKTIVQQTIQELGVSSVKDMGNVMKAVMAKAPGVDGKLVNQFAREILK